MVIVKGPGIISDLLIWGPGGFRGVRVICLQRWGLGDPRLSGLERFSNALLAPRLSPPPLPPPLRKADHYPHPFRYIPYRLTWADPVIMGTLFRIS